MEIELKLALRAVDLPRLKAHPLLTQQTPRRARLRNTYYDTPTLGLMERRVAVRERQVGRQTLLTVKTAGQSAGGLSRREEWEAPTRPGAFDFDTLVSDPALARDLSACAWQLVPVFRTDFTRLTWQLQHREARVEVALDQGHITTGDGQGLHHEPILELELELLAGRPEALFDLAHTLALGPQGQAASGLWLHPQDRSKAERGLSLFLGRRLEPAPAMPVRLRAQMTPLAAFQAAALSCLAHFQANVTGLLQTPPDTLPAPEFVHQARVALRRLRTGLRLFAPFLPRRFTRHWNTRWRATAGTLGMARDWDVLATERLPELLEGATPDPALDPWVAAQRHRAWRKARQMLTAPDHALNLLAFTRAVLALPVQTPRQPSAEPLRPWARALVRERHLRLRTELQRALRAGPEGRHQLRIELKKLRYAQSFLSDLLPPGKTRRSTEALAEAQALLGELNDLATADALLLPCPVETGQGVRRLAQERLQMRLQELPALERRLLRLRALRG
ncbi:MAG: CHAD domain-containing protein [Hydrogenophaga sp.]|nr:CHAD domain-containing protein [Hydrogenophaga sp.]